MSVSTAPGSATSARFLLAMSTRSLKVTAAKNSVCPLATVADSTAFRMEKKSASAPPTMCEVASSAHELGSPPHKKSVSMVQVVEQPSSALALPSSHASGAFLKPSPQLASTQAVRQPSRLSVSSTPSSQLSPWASLRLEALGHPSRVQARSPLVR